MFPTLVLSAAGGLWLWQVQSRRRRPALVDQLALPATPAHAIQALPPARQLTDAQNLGLALSVLGLTTVGHLGFPLLRLVSMPGLLYFDFYFIRTAYTEWQQQRQIGIATNDAVLATGMVITRQWGAGALFATLFFASRRLQALASKTLAPATLPTPMTVAPPAPASPTDPVAWQRWIDRGALPLLTLSAVSTPLLGFKRALAVLLTNFGYDYRITAPLSTMSYRHAAHAQGIQLRDPHSLDRLPQVDVLLLAVDWPAQEIAALHETLPVQLLLLPEVADPVAVVKELQAAGHTVAYVTNREPVLAVIEVADLCITALPASAIPLTTPVHISLPADHPAALQHLFALTGALAATRQRGFYLAFVPGLLNLGGIYFGHFGIITALLVEYGGTFLGLLNATWPQFQAASRPQLATAPLPITAILPVDDLPSTGAAAH